MASISLTASNRWEITHAAGGGWSSSVRDPLDTGVIFLTSVKRTYIEWDTSSLKDFYAIDSAYLRYMIKVPYTGSTPFHLYSTPIQPSTVFFGSDAQVEALWEASATNIASDVFTSPDETLVTQIIDVSALRKAWSSDRGWYAVYFRIDNEMDLATKTFSISTLVSNMELVVTGTTLNAVEGKQNVSSSLDKNVVLSAAFNTSNVDRMQWQIFLFEQNESDVPTRSVPFPITITTNKSGATTSYANVQSSQMDELNIQLPPFQRFKFRVRQQINGSWQSWSAFKEFYSPGLTNSYDRYKSLSGIE